MALVKELKIPIIVVCQLNRIAEGESPQLSHLGESGYLEQDAQCIILFDRERYLKEGHTTIDTHVNIAKNRHGPTGMVELDFYPDIVTFKDSNREYQEPQKENKKCRN
jgi:replicative DNA helicase